MGKIKCKNMMYAQKWSHRPSGIESAQDLVDRIETRLHPVRYAVIVHDKDVDKDGDIKETDIHAMMCFKNARYLDAVAKKIGDKAQYIEKWDGDANNGFSYLLHRTNDARKKGKHQYDPGDAKANFDFAELMQTLESNLVQAEANTGSGGYKIDELLNAMYLGIMTKEEAEKHMTGAQYGRYRRQVEEVWAKRLRNLAAEWREEMKEQGKQVTVIWLYGEAGTGKTRLAREIATKRNQPYYISGSSRDVFQAYSGEHTIILDELRPKVMEYQDILRIMDPFGLTDGVMAPSRYVDKPLAVDLIIITTPYSPWLFYRVLFPERSGQTDRFDQLERRITATIYMQQSSIDLVSFDAITESYIPDAAVSRPNPYSQQSRPTSTGNAADVFHQILD